MYSLLFRNRWIAVLWVLGTIASASAFVGEKGGADLLARTAKEIGARRTTVAVSASPPHQVTVESDEPPLPALLPAEAGRGDPANPQVGDEFIDPVSGNRVRIVRRAVDAMPAEGPQ